MKVVPLLLGAMLFASPAIPASLGFQAGPCGGFCAVGGFPFVGFGDRSDLSRVVFGTIGAPVTNPGPAVRKPRSGALPNAAYSAKNDPFSIYFLSDEEYVATANGTPPSPVPGLTGFASAGFVGLRGGLTSGRSGPGSSGASGFGASGGSGGSGGSSTGNGTVPTTDGGVATFLDPTSTTPTETISPVPLPASVLLLAGGLLGLAATRRRRTASI